MSAPLTGLIAATYTPMQANGDLNLAQVPRMVEHLRGQNVAGLYVCGSTGEGISLSGDERQQVAAAYVRESGDLPVVVQVGHNSLWEGRVLAQHAQSIGATAISANAPSYFKITDVKTLVLSMQEIASGAPDLPFYYYHIPHLTGATVDMLQFLEAASQQIPNLAGIKYTAPTLHDFLACRQWNPDYSVFWGSDEMLLGALSMGAEAAVGSTYNFMGRMYSQVMRHFEAGEIEAARDAQTKANHVIALLYRFPFHAAAKATLGMQGVECGPCRLPLGQIGTAETAQLQADLEAYGFFDW